MRFADDQKASSESAVESRSGSSKQMEEAEARPGGYARTHQSGCRAPTSAAFGRFHAPRTAQVPRIRPFRPFYPLRTRWRPMNPLSPCSHSCLRSPRRRHRHPQRTDAHGTHGTHAQLAPDCAVEQAASAASAAPIEPSTSAAQQPASPVRPLSACHCTHPPHAHAPARSLHRPGRCLQRGDVEVAANASDADGSAEEDAGSMHATLRPPFGRNSAGTGGMPH